MTFDLSATFARGGAHLAARQVVREFFGVDHLIPTATTVELLRALRQADTLSLIPQPQDQLLSDSAHDHINGSAVVAEENQVLWCATLAWRAGQPTVVFFEEPPEGRSPETELRELGALDLDRFLLGLLVTNATYSDRATRFRADIEPHMEIGQIVAKATHHIVGVGQFPVITAGPGWFGLRWPTRVEIVAMDPQVPASVPRLDARWERFTEIPPSQTDTASGAERSPWRWDPTVSHWRWVPVDR